MGASISRVIEEARLKNNLHELNLNSVGIKELPQDLEDYRSLVQVNLANNNIRDLPYTLEPFINLEVLNLYNNVIRRLPEFGIHSRLRILIASVNKIKILPNSMAMCKHLTSIDLSSNKFKEFPTVLCTLVTLQVVRLADNKIKMLPAGVGQLTSLETLDISNNKIRFLPIQIGYLVNLRELFVNHNKLRVLPIELSALPLVENDLSLHLFDNPLKRRIKKRHRKGNRVLWTYLRSEKYRAYLAEYMDRYERKMAKKMRRKDKKKLKERARVEKNRRRWEKKTRRKMEKRGMTVAAVTPPSAAMAAAGTRTGRPTTTSRQGVVGGTQNVTSPSFNRPGESYQKLSPEGAVIVMGVSPAIARTAPPITLEQPMRSMDTGQRSRVGGLATHQSSGYEAQPSAYQSATSQKYVSDQALRSGYQPSRETDVFPDVQDRAQPTSMDRNQLDRNQFDRTQLDRNQFDGNQMDRNQFDRTQVDRNQFDRTQVDRTQMDRNQLDRNQFDKSAHNFPQTPASSASKFHEGVQQPVSTTHVQPNIQSQEYYSRVA